MRITNKQDGIHILGHGVLSVSEMIGGETRLDFNRMGMSLAKINRYAGNTPVPWNDAEHSLLVKDMAYHVSKLVDIEELFLSRSSVVDLVKLYRFLSGSRKLGEKVAAMARHWALLHDVVEVVVGDTPNPVKQADERFRRSGDMVEDKLVATIKAQALGSYAEQLANEFIGTTGHPHFVKMAILELMQDIVKPADKLALLVEMHALHDPEVLDYVYRLWEVNPATQEFVSAFKPARLLYQKSYGNVDWRDSAYKWSLELERSERTLKKLFA